MQASRDVRAAPPTHRGRRSGAVRLDIQGLRALAVLAVVLDHAAVPFTRGGYVGVDVFFVLSGFLITGLLVTEAERSGQVGLRAFYARRARRILPAATLVLVAIVGFAVAELSYRAVERITVDAAWAAAFLSNVHFAAVGTDYFSQGLPPSPVQNYWSLSVEEQFYVVWPPLLALLLLLHRRRRPTGRPWPLVATVAGALCLASLVWSVLLTRSDPSAAYFSSLARVWELGTGMLLALAAPHLRGLGRRVRELLAVTGLAAVLLAIVGFHGDTPFPGYHALLPVLGTVAMIASGVAPGSGPTVVGRLLSLRPLTWLGDLSYSVYLWHWPVLVLWAERSGHPPGPWQTVVLLAVALALSVGTYHLVENPVRRGAWWRATRWRGLVLWPAALAVVAVAVVGGRQIAGDRLEQRLDDAQQYTALRSEDVSQRSVRAELAESLRMADADSPVAFPLHDLGQVDDLARDLWNEAYSCWVSHDRSTARICPVGDVDATRTIVVVGDSHAGQWLPAIDAIGRERGYRVVPLVKYGCVPYAVAQLTEAGGRRYTECDDFRSWVLDELASLHPDVVYVGSRSTPPNMVAPPAERPAAWSHGVHTFLDDVRAVTPDVRVLGDTSPLDLDPIDCLTDPRATMASCTSDETDLVRRANELTERAAVRAGATYLDLLPLACLDSRCPAFAGGRMVHANFDHLSVDWVRHVVPAFEAIDGWTGQG